jgi:hypothetical protein
MNAKYPRVSRRKVGLALGKTCVRTEFLQGDGNIYMCALAPTVSALQRHSLVTDANERKSIDYSKVSRFNQQLKQR